MSGLLGFVTSRLLHALAKTTAAAPSSEYRFFNCIIGIISMSKWGSERQLHLTSESPEVGITEAVHTEIEVTASRYVGIKSGVLGPGVQVATDESELDATRDPVNTRKLHGPRTKRVRD